MPLFVYGTLKRGDLADGTPAWAYLYARPVPAGTPSGDEWPFPISRR